MVENTWLLIISNIVIGTGCTSAGVVIGLLIRPWFNKHDIILANKQKGSKDKENRSGEKKPESQEKWDNI